MIRPIMAVVIATAIILFVWQYAAFIDRIRPEPIQIVEVEAQGRYDVRVVCTFDCQGNDFGLPAIKVQFRDRILIERKDLVPASQVVTIEGVPDVKQGLNDFHVQVTPVEDADSGTADGGAFSLEPQKQTSAASIARAVRVEILHEGHLIASELIWSNSSGPFGELVKIQVEKDGHRH